MTAEVEEIEPLATAEMTGAAAVVVKLEFVDVAVKFDAFVDTTSKS
jgi:hypothetical protein